MNFKPKNVVLTLIGINIVIFILQSKFGSITTYFMLWSPDILTRPWILLTHMFLHNDIGHLFFNLYALMMFGGFLETKIGSKRFLYLYLSSGLLAGLVSSFFYKASLGASGAIMGIIATLMILMPNLRLLFFIIPMKFWMAGVIWIFIDVMGIFFPSGVGNIAHLVGMAAGFAYGFYLKYNRGKYRRSFSKKKHLSQNDIDNFLSNGRI